MPDTTDDTTVDLAKMPIIVLSDDTPTVELQEAMVNLARAAKPLSRTRRDQVERWANYHNMISTIQDMIAERDDACTTPTPSQTSTQPSEP